MIFENVTTGFVVIVILIKIFGKKALDIQKSCNFVGEKVVKLPPN